MIAKWLTLMLTGSREKSSSCISLSVSMNSKCVCVPGTAAASEQLCCVEYSFVVNRAVGGRHGEVAALHSGACVCSVFVFKTVGEGSA